MTQAGPKLKNKILEILSQIPKLEYGQVVMTKAYNFDNHEYLLHVRSPTSSRRSIYLNNTQTSLNQMIYYNLLDKAFVELDLDSLAIPLIGTGAAGISIKESATDLIKAIHKFQSENLNIKKQMKIYVINNNPNILIEAEAYLNREISILCQTSSEAAIKQETKDEPQSQTNDDCIICLDKIVNCKKLDKCGHKFCKKCIDEYFEKVKRVCPVCNTFYGQIRGNQPNGRMTYRTLNINLSGFPQNVPTIEITYSIPNGIQGHGHPSPGSHFYGTTRVAYLPDNQEGRKVLGLLQKAFDQRLIFTIGQSRTNGADNVVTWNDIHHKTSINGGSAGFGYPDPSYLNRVLQELADKGIF